ncbi:MAG: hypothetical protein IPP32_14005 [Bacteroidetes bacterium]|nr:hypothetical protein [Bacteroidota bacterium]
MKSKFFSIQLSLFFSLFVSSVFSQSTGYMGNRLLVGYGLNVSPAIFGPNADNETILGRNGSASSGSPAFNLIHEGNLDAILSNKWIASFTVRYYSTAYDNARPMKMNYNSYYYSNYSRPNGYYSIKGLTYTLAFKYFKSKYIAPWGHYIMFGPTLNTVETSYTSNMTYSAQSNYSYKDTLLRDFGPSHQKFKGLNLMLGWGRSRIFVNRIVLDYGFNMQVFSVLSTFIDFIDTEEDPLFEIREINTLNYIERTNKWRVRGVNRFNVFLKVGFLLF